MMRGSTSSTRVPPVCGNVAANIAALGARAAVFSVVGEDQPAGMIRKLLADLRIADMTVADASRPTTKKNRIVAHKQQVARVDWEKRHAIGGEVEKAVIEKVDSMLHGFDIIVLSDYAKGFLNRGLCAHVIESARKLGKPVIVDPKDDFKKYAGASVITPNFREFRDYGQAGVGRSPAEMAPYAKAVLEDTGISGLVVTMGEDGMALFERGKYAKVGALQDGHEVVDITGAGDTAVAVYSLAVAAGADYVSAMRLANYAAGVVVTKFGTATCSAAELRSVFGRGDGLEEVYL